MTFIIINGVWLVVTGWVANDAKRRNRHWFGWAALVWFTSVVGLIIWLIVRRRSPVVGESPGIGRSLVLGAAASVPLLLLSVALTALTVMFVFQVGRNLGHAMEPTLDDQDRLIINKLGYQLGDAQVGDVVMLRYPLDPTKLFAKRVIAREGDTVRIVDGRVTVNDVPIKDAYVPDQFRSHDDWGPAVVPQGYFFVLGDHRNNSSDSRHWGYVPKGYILGKIVARFGGQSGWAMIQPGG
jgi:signal peptidase I